MMLHLSLSIMNQIIVHAVQKYPDEACGFLMGPKGRDLVTEFCPMKNIYNEMHARYPETYPRTARTAYLIDPGEQQKVFEKTASGPEEVKSIVHSHTDHDAYFSEEDQLVAAPWGEPSFPGISFVVVSIYEGKFKETNDYAWHEAEKSFIKRPMNIS